MWLFPLMFFTYQFILRLWPGLMMQQIMEQFSIDARHFGLIAAFYYYGYASMQIPVALLLDKYGARYILFIFAVLCGVATLLFTYSNNWYLACVSRFLVGAGSAVGFLSISKVVSEWFPDTQYSKMIGFSFSVGLMGAVYGGKPVSVLIETYYWKNVALTLALIAIIIGCGSFVILRQGRTLKTNKPNNPAFNRVHFKAILSSLTLWLLAFANFLMVGALEGFSDVWGIPYLMTAYSITKSNAAQLISFVFLGMLFGGPILALFSKKWGNYTVITLCGFGMAIAFCALLLSKNYHWWYLASLLFSIGVMCCYQVIVFAAGAQLAKSHYLGITIAFLNCINMLGGSFFHTAIGKIVDISWTGSYSGEGIKQYNLASYQLALMLIPVCATIGAGITCWIGLTINRKKN
jgi:MFS family permease